MSVERYDINDYTLSSITPGKIYTITFASLQSYNSRLPETFDSAPQVDIGLLAKNEEVRPFLIDGSINTTQFQVGIPYDLPQGVTSSKINIRVIGERA